MKPAFAGVAVRLLAIAAWIVVGGSAQAGDEALVAVRAIRNAEVAADAKSVEAGIQAAVTPLVADFARVAREAITLRAGAATAADLVGAEDRIERSRRALAGAVAATDPSVAQEILLQCAEDILLRRLTADSSDALIAVGILTDSERADLEAVLVRADEALAEPSLASLFAPSAALATDPCVFRARFLAGLAAATRADLEREPADGPRRATAARLLGDAAQSELRVPPSIAHALAFARARTTTFDAERTRFLDEARAASDPTLRFAVECMAWRRGPVDAAFPRLAAADAGAAALAAIAEWRARRERGQSAALAAGALSPAVRAHGAVAARAIARRIDAASRAALVADPGASGLALAIIAVHPIGRAGDASGDASNEASDKLLAARAPEFMELVRSDPTTRPWLSLPLARALAATNRPVEACEVLRAFIDGAHESAAGRAALDVAIGLARTAAARSAHGEIALEETLALAGRRSFADASYNAWMLERVDLALFPRWSEADPSRAARLLVAVTDDDAYRGARELRELEIDGSRAKRAGAAAIAERAEKLARMASADAECAGRAHLVLAAMRALEGNDRESGKALERALASGAHGARTEARAAALWIELASRAKSADAPSPPASLVDLARANPEVRERVAEAIAGRADEFAAALAASDAEAEASRSRLAALEPLASSDISDRDLMLLALACGRADDAVRAGERAAQDDRTTRWLLAEALLRRGSEGDEARAFELLRGLSPMQASERDSIWWTAQCLQLEILARKPERATDVLSRLNRLEALDPELGGKSSRRRLDTIRASAEDAVGGSTTRPATRRTTSPTKRAPEEPER